MRGRARDGGAAAEPYADHWEHLRDELRYLDAVLRELVARLRSRRAATVIPAAFGQGLFIGDEEIDTILEEPAGGESLAALRERIDARVGVSRTEAVHLPLAWLEATFGLSHWERQVLVLCLAPEILPAYERVYAYLQDDVARRRPGLELVLELLGAGLAERAAGRDALAEGGRLRRAGLVAWLAEGQPGDTRGSPLLRLDERVTAFLLGSGAPGERDWLRLSAPRERSVPPIAEELARFVRRSLEARTPTKLVLCLHGAQESFARAAAEAVSSDLDCPLLVLDLAVLEASAPAPAAALREAVRESLFQTAVLLVTGTAGPAERPDAGELRLRRLAAALDDFAWLALVHSRQPLTVPEARVPWLAYEIVKPGLDRLAQCWQAALSAAGLEVPAAEAQALASRYNVGPGEVERAVASARAYGLVHDGTGMQLADVEAACRQLAAGALGALATRVSPRAQWDDIVLPGDRLRQLRELERAVRSRHRVLAEWGLAARASRGLGLGALFSGPSGTGKTMAAEIIAGTLGMDLYVVDLAAVVSKYIGETEKNLERVFDAAESTSCVLLFDEADALFGKRSEVRDAHDRYANIETGYLLQRIETYGGLVILATNLKRNLDEAFLRRLAFAVEFSVPDVEERERIWRAVLPPAAPLAGDVAWAALASPFTLPGGSIRSAALHAAYQAAADARPVGMADLLLGVRRELEKLGRAPNPSDFGAYWEQVVSG